jgi:hypothetical protein
LFSDIEIPVGPFVSLAVVRTSNIYSLYVNGVEVATATDVSPDLPTNHSWQLSGRPGHTFVGEADEIATFDRALTDAEVKSLSRFHSVQKNALATQEPVANRHPAHDNNTTSSPDTPVSAAANKLLAQAVALYRAEGNADDSAGKHHGKLQGGARIAETKDGHAFEFDGHSDCVVVPEAPQLNATGQITMTAWIHAEPTWADVVTVATDASGEKRTGFYMGISPDGNLYSRFNAPGELWDTHQAWGGVSVYFGGWVHVAATYDGHTLAIYANGATVLAAKVGDKPLDFTGTRMVIGAFNAPGFAAFKGMIDDVAIFDRGLSQAEVETIYRGTLEGKAGANDLLSDAVAWYRAECNADDSAGTHKGKLEGGVAFKAMKSRRVFDFDGTGSITVADAADLNPQNRFTVMAWICPRNAPQSESVIISKIGNASGSAGYELGLSPPDASLFVAFNTPGEPRRANSLRWHPIASGQWVHVAARYDGDELVTFLNGGAISRWNCGSGCGGKTVAPSHANFRISGDDDGKSRFDGLVDNVAFFNQALSNTEIQTIYRGTFGELRGDDMGDFVRLRAGGGVQTPVEYAGPLDVSFVARTDGLNIRLFSHSHESVIWNWESNTSELRVVMPDGSLATPRVAPLEPNRWYQFRYVVTPQGTKVWVDDNVVFESSRSNAFFPPSPVRVYTAFGSVVDVKDFTVKPIEWLTAEQEVVLAQYTNAGTIDVLSLIDSARDAKSGKWTMDFDGLHYSPDDIYHAALRLPVAVPKEYCLVLVGERRNGRPLSLDVGLVCAENQADFVIDHGGASGISLIDGKNSLENESTVRCGNLLQDGRASVVAFIVRRGGIQLQFDGREVLNWQGDYHRLGLEDAWRNATNSPLRLFLGPHCDWHFKAIRLTPLISAEATAVTSPSAQKAETDLLKTIDIKTHARGGWGFDGPVLVSPANVSHAGVRFPGVVPDEYRLRIIAERPRSFQGPPQLHLGLVTPSSQATLVLDADHKSGLESVGGKMYHENATTFQGDLFIDGIESTIDCTVGTQGIRVDFDDHTIIDWHGDPKQLKPTWTQFGAPKRTFWIGTHCNYRIKTVQLVSLTKE